MSHKQIRNVAMLIGITLLTTIISKYSNKENSIAYASMYGEDYMLSAGAEDILLDTQYDLEEEVSEEDPDDYWNGAGVELVIGSTDSMTRQDFEELMEDLTIQGSLHEEYNWGYTNLGIANVQDSLNIRKEPSADAEKVGELPGGAACEIMEIVDGWAHIVSGRVEGYVSVGYLLEGDAAKEYAEQEQRLTATVITSSLRVRKQPDTEHGTWALVKEGAQFDVLEELDNGWVSIVYGDGQDAAYLSGEYVEVRYTLETALTLTEVRYGKGVTDVGVDIANKAIQYVGHPYVYGGTSLTNGTDCSGFTMLLYKQYGVSLSHSARAQSKVGTRVSISELRPGDLVFYGNGGGINHVAMYIGGGQVCHASNERTGIIISNLYYRTPVCATRIF